MKMSETRWFEYLRWGMLLGVTAWSTFGAAQEPANRTLPPSTPDSLREPASDSLRELREQVRELQAAVAGMRSDWQQARAETAELRRELDQIRAGEVRTGAGLRDAVLSNAVAKPETGNSEASVGSLQKVLQGVLQNPALQDQATENQKQDQKEGEKKSEHTASLDEEYQLLTGKSGRSVPDESRKRIEVPRAALGHCSDESGEQSGCGG